VHIRHARASGRQAKEEEEYAKSRGPHLEKLKEPLLVICEMADKSPFDLLKHIYRHIKFCFINTNIVCSLRTQNKRYKAARSNKAERSNTFFVHEMSIAKKILLHAANITIQLKIGRAHV